MYLLESFPMLCSVPRSVFWDGNRDCASRFENQLFGLGMLLDDLLDVPNQQVSQHRSKHSQTGVSKVKNENNGFHVKLDVSEYRPEELSVKTVDDFIVVQGKHQEKQDEHGFVQREFVRRFALPSDVEPQNLNSSLSPDGYLNIVEAPKAPKPLPNKVRNVPITMLSAPIVSNNENVDISNEKSAN